MLPKISQHPTSNAGRVLSYVRGVPMPYNPDALVTGPEVAGALRISAALISKWRELGKLSVQGYRGRSPLYKLSDIQRVERETRRSPYNLKRSRV